MLKRYNPESIWQIPGPFQEIYTHAVEVTSPEKILLVSGQIGVAPDGAVPDLFDNQCHQAMENVEALLAAASLSKTDILRVTYYLVHSENLVSLSNIRKNRWGSAEPPAVTTLVVAALAQPKLLIEIEVTAGR